MINKIDIKNSRTQIVITAAVGAVVGVLTSLFMLTFSDLPQVEQLQNYEPQGVTRLNDKDGNLVYQFYREKRIAIKFEEIPNITKKAFLSTEDWSFYKHVGIDIPGIARAVIKNFFRGRFAQGASTITQQLSRVLFLSPDKTIARKLREILLTFRIENRFTKDEILALYLNQIYLGEGTYGIESAAQKYFGKPVSKLTIAENAMLASLPKAPNIYSPFKDAKKALDRRNANLTLMFERDVITEKQFREAMKEPLPKTSAVTDPKQNYFSFHILEELTKTMEIDEIYRGKLQIQSTLDMKLQEASEKAITQGLKDYAARHKIPADKWEKLPQAAMVAIDPNSGEVRALVGGRAFSESQFDRILQAQRQPGSSFKPFIYGFALEKGYTQATAVLDAPLQYKNSKTGTWSPGNYDGKYEGYIPMRISLEKSKNTPTIRILEDVGLGSFQRWMSRFQITTKIANDLTVALGSSSMKLMELARSYAIFANGGFWVEPSFILSVKNDANEELWEKPRNSKPRVMEATTAGILTDMLRGVIQTGTGRAASNLPCELAAKTGTTDNYVDSLFVGYSSELVVLVWVGFDQRKPLGFGETGAMSAGKIWRDVMAHHCSNDSPDDMNFSNELVWVDVDHETGFLPNSMSVNILKEAFIKGTEPTKDCCKPDYYGKLN
jgi:penicillin-binding protein 1A